MLNVSIIEGRLTAEPTLTQTEKTRYCRFRIASDRPKRKDGTVKTDFIQCIAFEGNAEIVTKWFHKGDKITVVGRYETNPYEDNGEKRISHSINVREVHFGNVKKSLNDESAQSDGIDPAEFEAIFADEDVPF